MKDILCAPTTQLGFPPAGITIFSLYQQPPFHNLAGSRCASCKQMFWFACHLRGMRLRACLATFVVDVNMAI